MQSGLPLHSLGRIAASLDRKCLGPSEVTSGLGRRLVGRDIFDEETRWKLLAIAADANLLSLYMGFEWRFRLSFALRLLTTTRLRGVGAVSLRRPYYGPKLTAEREKIRHQGAREASAALRLRSSRVTGEWGLVEGEFLNLRSLNVIDGGQDRSDCQALGDYSCQESHRPALLTTL